jgi:hypothetical protein
MKKRDAALISLLLGLAVVLGMFATARTTGLARQAGSAGTAQVQARKQRLARARADIERARKSHPPALPARSAAPVVVPRVRYVRPEPAAGASTAFGEHENDWGEESDD